MKVLAGMLSELSHVQTWKIIDRAVSSVWQDEYQGRSRFRFVQYTKQQNSQGMEGAPPCHTTLKRVTG
jgi:hypothetical protein